MTMTGKLLIAAATLAAFSGSAMAADLYVPPAAPVAAAPAVSSTNWDGPYIGATIGYGWGTLTDTTADPDVSADINGFRIGGQLGYNFHLADSIVAGVQGDINWNNSTGSLEGDDYRINWDGAVVGRLGVDVDSILPYVEAGVAFANADWGPDNATHTGWTVGAGVEFMLADQLSANVEYRYVNYGSQSYGGTDASLTDNQFRVGLNYHF